MDSENNSAAREDNPFVEKFEAFFKNRCVKEIERLAAEYPTKRSLNVDFRELEHYDFELADEMLANSDVCLDAARSAIKNIDVPLLENADEFAPHIRFYNLPAERQPILRDLSASHIGKLITVEGVVRLVTDVLPKLKFATWKCQRCEATYKIPQTRHQTRTPTMCSECKNRSFILEEETSDFEDYQKIQIQEPLEVLKGSEQATNLDIYVTDDIVNMISPGDKTKITGIIRLMPPTKEKKNIYGRYLEALHLEETAREFEEVEINAEEEEEIRKLAASDDVYDQLIQSIAPHIYGHEVMKEAIALQLFGGVRKKLPNDQHVRGNIHVLIVGDPGMAKCVSADTKMLLANGTSCRMDEFVGKFLDEKTAIKLDDGFYTDANAVIPLMDDNGKIKNGNVVRVYKRKPIEMMEITTWGGRKIKVTHTHPFFIPYHGKIKAVRAKYLNTKDHIAVPRKLELESSIQHLKRPEKGKTNAVHIKVPETLNSEVARFMGYFCGEGYSERSKSTIELRFTNSDKEVLDDFIGIAENQFGINPQFRTRNGATEVIISGVELGSLLKKNAWGILEKSAAKNVPQKILTSPIEIKRNFLRGYIEGEGHVRSDIRMIEVCTASKELSDDVRQLLLEFGVLSTVKYVRNCATNGTKIKRNYYKTCIGGKFAIKFAKEIGFITQRKNDALKKFVLNGKITNTNVDVIPNIGEELTQTRMLLGLTQFDMGISRTTYQHFEHGDRNPSRESLQKIALVLIGELEKKSAYEKEVQEKVLNIYKQAFSGIYWDKIRKIEKIKNEEWIYDVEVEKFHNFISNGIISHNSQILRATDSIAPKSIYVAGKTSTGAGLSATAVKDEFGEGGWTLKAGALVLASGGMAMVDEFDKMETEDRSAMHEAMEQQQISVAKAGIVTKFKTETSILAAANPKHSRFDPYQPFIEQIDLPASLISRFDLFFMIKDVLDRKRDEEIANHIVRTHRAGEMMLQREMKGLGKSAELEQMKVEITPKISGNTLKKYISYARQKIFPIIADNAMKEIVDFYVSLRDQGRKEGAYSATHRQLEGIIRLSEASARVRLSDEVTRGDVERAIRLVKTSLQDLVTDPETGKIDIDIITSGQTHTQLSNMRKILGVIKEKAQQLDMVPIEEIIDAGKALSIDADKVRDLLLKLQKSGDIYYPKHGFVKPA